MGETTRARTLRRPARPKAAAPVSGAGVDDSGLDMGFLESLTGYNARRGALAVIGTFLERMALEGSADAYVAVPHDEGLSPQTGATFEAWIFASNLSGCRAIFGKNYLEGYWVGVCNGRIRFHSGGNASAQDGTTVILPNVWTHIAVVWDPVFNVRRYFINGDFDYLGAAGPAPTGTRQLRIGGDQTWDSFAGFIAEARIWNVARDQADIRRTMHSYVDEKLPGLAAAWPFRADYTDVIGGRTGTATGTSKGIFFVGTDAVRPFPLRPATVVADEHVGRLEIEVDEPARVGGLDRPREAAEVRPFTRHLFCAGCGGQGVSDGQDECQC